MTTVTYPPATRCDVHKTHTPTPLRFVTHHCWPLAMGGPNEAGNWVQVCDTGHFNIHRLLDDLLDHGQMRRGGTRTERALAQRGYDEWTTAGRPGHPVYELEEHP